jgi:lipid A 3-O-deacylase
MAAPLGAAISQPSAPRTLTLRIDNDAFDFWMMPWNRPDEEYTSGVHITYEGGPAPRWSRRVFGAGAVCALRVADCRTERLELGQDIYTPAVDPIDLRAGPQSRASAGWLYLSQSARSLREARSDDVTLTLGVTGPPSLARFTQRLAHSAAPAFNRPTDWTRELAFEPGVILRYEQRRRFSAGEGKAIGADVLPLVAVAAGNVNTSAEVGFQSRVGWRLPHPWLTPARDASVIFIGGATGRAVARDIFLDGNTFSGENRVGHKPFVGSGEIGVELRFGGGMLGYHAVTTTRAYAAAPPWHPWGSLVAAISF